MVLSVITGRFLGQFIVMSFFMYMYVYKNKYMSVCM